MILKTRCETMVLDRMREEIKYDKERVVTGNILACFQKHQACHFFYFLFIVIQQKLSLFC